ncbi:unnamed protein product [Miscanthus lutarioriparius]|uniref:Uncharacterized protein n=1 Tax=Miscanthus lutarioriparius TaxID=422564 RepID=A0A811S1Q0_9POAL|nr:unnamed protein product [Miscanthus lutarioriparius]
MVKPARVEQLWGIWTHVVKDSKTDPRNNIRSGDGDKVENVRANHTKKYSRKNKKAVDAAHEDNENTSTQKKQRVQWCGQLHQKFLQAIQQIGIDRAVPKNILEVMNVEGLTRENVASHLQIIVKDIWIELVSAQFPSQTQYCVYVNGICVSDTSTIQPEHVSAPHKALVAYTHVLSLKYRIFLRKLNEGTLRNSNPFADETEALRRNMSVPSFIGSPSSSNHFAKVNSSSAIGTQASLPTESVQVMSSHKNLGIPQSHVEPVGHCVNLPKNAVPMPVQDISRFISSGKSYAPVSSGGLSGASHSYARIVRGMISGSIRGIPFEDISDGEMLAPSGHLPLQSPDLVNQPSVQLQSCSAGQFNKVASEVHQIAGPSNSSKVAVPSRFSDLGHNVGTSEDPSQGNISKINQLLRFAGSSGHIPTFGNEYQRKIAGIMGHTVPMVGFREEAFSFGNNTHSTATPIGNSALASSSSTRPDLQIDNSVTTQVLNGCGASDNLLVGSIVNQQAVSDQVNNINDFLMGTSEAQNGESDDVDDFLAYFNQDFVNNGDSFIDGDREFAP